MNIEIKEVTNRRMLRQFINFANKLYKYSPYYCPPLFLDELNTFNRRMNPALKICDCVCYLAYSEGQIVGRVCGIINHCANQKWQNNRVRFGWFDFIDNMEVSHALLNAVAEWGRQHGMTELNGPLGFTDFDHEGLLIEGYDYDSPMASLYNYPYYVRHLEAYGLRKEVDWIEYRIFIPDRVPEKMERVAKIAMERYHLRIDKVHSAKELVRRYGYTFFDVIDLAYQPLYNFQPLTAEQKRYYTKMYMPMLNYDFVTIVVNEVDEIVGVGVGMPNISSALRACNGRLFPFGWWHLLRMLRSKRMHAFDLLLIAVRPDYQNKGVNSLFFYDQTKYFVQYGVHHSETTSILETNIKNQANWSYFERAQHKRRRAYCKKI